MSAEKISFRKAVKADLPAIIALLADDELGSRRENPGLPPAPEYTAAFAAIDREANQLLAVAVLEDTIIGTLHLTFIPGIARMGAWRGQIEAVRIARGHRKSGLGRTMFEWAIDQCKSRNCKLVQLTTDLTRPDAHRFYEGLGFKGTHKGYKLSL